MLLHILSEEGGIGESHLVADLLDAEVGLPQIVADVLHDMFRDPLVGGLPRLFLTDDRQVFGRYAQLAGVRLDTAVLAMFGVQQVEEALEVALAGVRQFGNLADGRCHLPHETAQPQNGGSQQ